MPSGRLLAGGDFWASPRPGRRVGAGAPIPASSPSPGCASRSPIVGLLFGGRVRAPGGAVALAHRRRARVRPRRQGAVHRFRDGGRHVPVAWLLVSQAIPATLTALAGTPRSRGGRRDAPRAGHDGRGLPLPPGGRQRVDGERRRAAPAGRVRRRGAVETGDRGRAGHAASWSAACWAPTWWASCRRPRRTDFRGLEGTGGGLSRFSSGPLAVPCDANLRGYTPTPCLQTVIKDS